MFWCIWCLLLQIIHTFPEQYIIRSSSIFALLTLQSSLKLPRCWVMVLLGQCLEVGLILHVLYFWILPTSKYCSSGKGNASGIWMLSSISKSVFILVSLSFLFLHSVTVADTLPICICKGKSWESVLDI